jgi:hypothetical protein
VLYSKFMMPVSKMKDRRETRVDSATAGRYWIPTRPYSLVDAVNRSAAATGSVRYARQAADSSYNGHSVTVTYNDFRDYCICEHYWGERVVHARGSMDTALRAGRYEYDMGHRGTRVITCDLTPGEALGARALGYIPWSEEGEEAWNALWYTELHGCVGEALGDGRQGCDTVHLLLQASSRVDYHERKARAFADQVFGVGKWRECRLEGPGSVKTRGMVLSGDRGGSVGPWAMVVVNGDQTLGGPIEHARAWWKGQIAAGWTVATAACG